MRRFESMPAMGGPWLCSQAHATKQPSTIATMVRVMAHTAWGCESKMCQCTLFASHPSRRLRDTFPDQCSSRSHECLRTLHRNAQRKRLRTKQGFGSMTRRYTTRASHP